MSSPAPLAVLQDEGEPVMLNNKFGIWPDAPLPLLSSPNAEAFVAKSKVNQAHNLFALACDPEIQPRISALEQFKELPILGNMRLLDWGVVPWTETGDYRFVVIYERPLGQRLVTDLDGEYPDIGEEALMARIIAPICGVLKEFDKYKIAHRNIRPTNLFFRANDDDGAEVLLGENTTTPPGYDQPPAFETIESLQAHPMGRKEGGFAEDVYALGVTALSLYKKIDPAKGRSAEALLAEKLARGSFATLVAGIQLPVTLREALRGMLEDDPDKRWTLEDLISWTDDRRLANRPIPASDKAQNAYRFMGKAYHQPQMLAQAMTWNWGKVLFKNKGHEILAWSRRSLGDEVISNNIFNAVESSQRDGIEAANNPLRTARLCMALDHNAPIRYKGIATHLEGLGPMLAGHFNDNEKRQEMSELLLGELPGFRAKIMYNSEGEGPGIMRYFTRFVRHLKQKGAGFGMERCLYDLNPAQYCRSPMIASHKAMDVKGLLLSLEAKAVSKQSQMPFDGHIAAFLASHLKTNVQMFIDASIDEGNQERSILGKLGLLATAQKESGLPSLPRLTKWVGLHLAPATASFRHRMWRERVERELPNIIATGNLIEVYRYLANGEARQLDRQGFAEAVAEYNQLSAEIVFNKNLSNVDPEIVIVHGHKLAAGLSVLIAIGAIAFAVMMKV
ncbi:MAG: hypothetical protein HN658_08760 [Rhodospirillales bacterium]|jgi:hypothetical protein|nr:hypothetical protein [Rhodospirillales bacterium]MBT4006805.1 hypothetical protein [Rhodospirillales bacterium]MBT5077131.1 hypothetical protein [Rhodospirillales bacterium]MBT5113716.1 hypothetical protein [Rhodospirillales bacterium]MBT5673971.1 hypothetical protein [Rhodospirillales bacterium]